MNLTPAERARYARHLSLAEIGADGQLRLKRARVLVVGAGGLGSPAALYLAAAGIGQLGVLDCDRVEVSNLQRQVLFGTADVGASKAEVARARLLALNPELQISALARELCAANVRETLAAYDVVVDGSDRIGTRYLINDACVIYRKALVSAAIHRFEGQAMTYLPDRGPCYRCLFPAAAEGAVPTCADAGVLGVLPGVLGALQATEVIKIVTGIGTPLTGRLLTYDALSMHFDEFRFERRGDCAVCGTSPSITVPADPAGFCTVEELERVPSITAPELATRLAAAAVRIVDVRDPAEFERGHLPGAINVPLARMEQTAGESRIDRLLPPSANATLVFVCLAGVRSRRACALARRAGLERTAQLQGGLKAWRENVDRALPL